MYSQIMDIVFKEYDENNTIYDDILLGGNSLECNITTGYRIGGFVGGRNCFNGIYESEIGLDSNEPPRDDIDDFNNLTYNIESGNKKYTISVKVGYSDNWNENKYDDKSLEYNFSNRSDDNKSQIKRVYVKISDESNNTISSIYYYSSNIGHAVIKSIKW